VWRSNKRDDHVYHAHRDYIGWKLIALAIEIANDICNVLVKFS
jgi:hypothetical protein